MEEIMRRTWLVLSVMVVASLLALSVLDMALAVAGRQRLNLPGRSDTRPYSHAVLAGDTLYVAGGIGIDPETGAPPAGIEDEIRLVMDGMKSKLALAGMTMDDLVTVQVFCPDLALYGQFNEVYATYFSDGYPARAFIGSGPLLNGGHFEVTGIAVKK
jgi:enamine deaminase RidA (YjgF/YER057c/UK114 family)